MENSKLILKTGKLEKTEGIGFEGNKWVFNNNDPQIYVEFQHEIQEIQILCDLGNADFEEANATLYFRKAGEGYCEENTCKIPFLPQKKIVREIHFDVPIKGLRFDPVDFQGKCFVKKISIEVLDEKGGFEKYLEEKIGSSLAREKVIVITHDLSMSGAPILAYHIANGLKDRGKDVVVLAGHAGNGYLEKKYDDKNIPVINVGDVKKREYDYITVSNTVQSLEEIKYKEKIVAFLKKKGFTVAIANSIVSGQFVDLMKNYNYKVISLIHEMKATIEFYGLKKYGEKIARYADYIVFPNQIVKNDFNDLFPDLKGKCLIQAQGVYLDDKKESINSYSFNLEEYNIQANDVVIMSSGTCELRKGVDLFVDAAIMLFKNCQKKNIHFIWTGDFNNPELECWVKNQMERSGVDENIHFIPFIKDTHKYRSLLQRANIFWAMSREDPFPSTVLEAMKNGVPIVGFSGTGGIQIMLSEKRGILIDDFDLNKFVLASKCLIEAREDYSDMVRNAKTYVDELTFDNYIAFLETCIGRKQVICPKLDLNKWGNAKHFYDQQLKEKSFEEKKIELVKASLKKAFSFTRTDKSKVVLLDTAKGSDNVEDEIIMDYCTSVCKTVLPNTDFVHIPTHIYDEHSEHIESYFKILCGTNLIYTRMENSKQWALPQDIANYKKICLLGVGMQQLGIEFPMSNYTKLFLRFILDSKCIHSVRDEQTKMRLEQIGVKNILNTGCPTMWRLTPEHCARIPTKKASNVLTTVTDYMKDREKDSLMLSALKKHYDNVFIWIQGQKDYEYLCEIVDLDDYIIIPPSLKELDSILKKFELDYIGTRLLAGIRSLNYFHRSCIIAIDNRARAIALDTNLPILERNEIKDKLESIIFEERKTKITIPLKEIELWKNQFRR